MALALRLVAALGALLVLALASAAPAATWRKVTGFGKTDSTRLDMGVARTANGVLNVLWARDQSVLNTRSPPAERTRSAARTRSSSTRTSQRAPPPYCPHPAMAACLLRRPDTPGGRPSQRRDVDRNLGRRHVVDRAGDGRVRQPPRHALAGLRGGRTAERSGGTGRQFRSGDGPATAITSAQATRRGTSISARPTCHDGLLTERGDRRGPAPVAIAWNDLDTGRTQVRLVQTTVDPVDQDPWFPHGR